MDRFGNTRNALAKSRLSQRLECKEMRQITIIGGGLAGLTLGILLRREDVPVILLEAGQYPRHRVCGEFISGSGLRILRELSLLRTLEANGRWAETVSFRNERITMSNTLPEPAFCISRYILDEQLANEFTRVGGLLQTKERYTGDFNEAGLVRATGRRLSSSVEAGRFLGLKVHARACELEADLEMHCSQKAYIGLCKLPGGEVNICGLFASTETLPALKTKWPEIFRQHVFGPARESLAQCEFDEQSFCAVSGISLEPFRGLAMDQCSIGDSLTMIPPVTGNGMSLALESAALMSRPLMEYSAGKLSWETATIRANRVLREKFRARLFWARLLQSLLFNEGGQKFLGWTARFVPQLWPTLFRRTRR
jgi:flavin-dependent dehydrogenase